MISIIVPVYNSEKKLPHLIDSIVSQTYKNFEVILIDDGSKDNSGNLCDDYACLYENFRVFHKSNGGQSSARNLGIKEAKGKYIYFADNDDELLPHCLETLVNGINKEDVDWAIGKPLIRRGDKLVNDNSKSIENIYSVNQILLEFFTPKYFPFQGPWSHLFKTSIINDNNIRFNETLIGTEDRVFIIDYLCCVKGKVFHTTKPIYIWNVGIGTLHNISTEYNKWYATIFYGQCEVYDKIRKHGFPKKSLWWAKHTMINSYVDKRKFYEKYNDIETVDNINKRFFLLASRKDLLLFKMREYGKRILLPLLPILRKLRG